MLEKERSIKVVDYKYYIHIKKLLRTAIKKLIYASTNIRSIHVHTLKGGPTLRFGLVLGQHL